MKVFESFEKKFLFSATRAVFLLLVLLAVITFSFSAFTVIMKYQDSRVSTRVSADSVFTAVETDHAKPPQQNFDHEGKKASPEDVEAGLKIPKIIQEIASGKNKEVLDLWLSSLDPKDRQNFIDEMNAVLEKGLEKAKSQGKNAIFGDILNKYKELKFQKIDERNLQETQFQSNMILYASVLGGLIAIISLLSLVLVLLAIERNTRKTLV